MIIGQTVHAEDGENKVFLTPWFPRVADNAIFTFERIHKTLSGAPEIDVLHKDAESTGTGSPLVSFAQVGSTGLYEAPASGIKEMVRFKLTIPDGTGWLHFRFLPPTWYPTGKV